MQIDADRTAAAVGKMALLDRAILGAPQPNQRIGLVMHIPVVLQSGVVVGDVYRSPCMNVRPRKQSFRTGVSSGPSLSMSPSMRINSINCGAKTGDSFRRPEVDFALLCIENPFAWFVEFLQCVLHPARFACPSGNEVGSSHRSRRSTSWRSAFAHRPMPTAAHSKSRRGAAGQRFPHLRHSASSSIGPRENAARSRLPPASGMKPSDLARGNIPSASKSA